MEPGRIASPRTKTPQNRCNGIYCRGNCNKAYLGTNPKYGFFKLLVQQPSKVAALELKNPGKCALFIPGFSNRFNYFVLTRILPRKMASYFANKTMKLMYS